MKIYNGVKSGFYGIVFPYIGANIVIIYINKFLYSYNSSDSV